MNQQLAKYSGEPTVESLASGLATLGRYGDTYMVHAAEGETVIPAEILEANPELKNQLFSQMKMMGIKDPDRYVVGNGLNSINPITGQPEFFFKKAFRSIRKVFKKVAPVIVPIVGNMIAPGIGGPIASALMTKMQGGSMSDAFRSAAMAYAGQTLAGGASKAFSQGSSMGYGKSFLSGLKGSALQPFEAAGNLFSGGAQNPLAQGIFGPRGANVLFREGAKELGANKFSSIGSALFPSYQGASANYGRPAGASYGSKVDPRVESNYSQRNTGSAVQPLPGTDPSSGMTVDQQLAAAGASDIDPSMTSLKPTGGAESGIFSSGIGKVAKDVATSKLGIAGLTAAGVYMLTPEEELPEEELEKLSDPQRTAYDQYLGMSDKSSPEALSLRRQAGIFSPYQDRPQDLANISGISLDEAKNYLSKFASGGEVIGKGTGTSDSINAKLSDGEFVMTAKAVQNAGGGNRDLGAARMYDLMTRFEGGSAYG